MAAQLVSANLPEGKVAEVITKEVLLEWHPRSLEGITVLQYVSPNLRDRHFPLTAR